MRYSGKFLFLFLFQILYFVTSSQNHSFSYTSPVCIDEPNLAPITSTNFATGGTFLSSPGLNLNSSTGLITLSLSIAGTYTVTYTGAICLCFTNSPVTATVTINPSAPPITLTGHSVCVLPGTTQYTITASPSSLTYTWLPFNTIGNPLLLPLTQSNITFTIIGAIGGCTTSAIATTGTAAISPVSISGSTAVCLGSAISLTALGSSSYSWSTGAITSVITETPSFTTVYTVTSTSANSCTSSVSHTVLAVPDPTISIAANATLCSGYAYSLTASGATSYTWSTGSVTPGLVIIPTASVTTYSVIGSNSGCTNTAMHTVSLVPLPTVTIVGTDDMCGGQTFTLAALGTPSYTWSTGSNANSISHTIFTTTTYSVQGMDTKGCVNQAIKTVTILPTPSVSVLGSNTICVGYLYTYTAIGGAISYTWSTGSVTNTLAIKVWNDTIYQFVVKGSNIYGCIDTRTFTVKAFESPVVNVTGASLCSNQITTVVATGSPSNITYQWLPFGGTTTNTMVIVYPPESVVFTVVAHLGGCTDTAFSYINVTQSIRPNVQFYYSNPFCTGFQSAWPAYLSGFTRGGIFYTKDTIILDENTGEVDLENIKPGTYLVEYLVPATGCNPADSSAAVITVYQSASITMANHIEIFAGQSVNLLNSGWSSYYIWEPPEGLSCTNCQVPIASPMQTTTYCVKSDQECTTGACITVEVLCTNGGDLSLPNAFSPNNDNNNDKFCLQGWALCNNKFQVIIYNRWGEQVFKSTDPNFCWDGKLNGEILPTGVYMYMIKAQFGKEPEFKRSGNISLVQ